MNHSFNCDVAKEVGVVPAVILENMAFWLLQKRANNKDFEDGNWWVYNSVKAWLELFPYLSIRKIRTAIETLVKEGFVIEGSQNKKNYDRTKWYAMTEKAWKFYLPESEKISDSSFVKSDKCSCQNRQMDLSKVTNGFVKSDKPIPDINTHIDADIDQENKRRKFNAKDYLLCVGVNEQIIEDWIALRKSKKAPVTKTAIEGIWKEANIAKITLSDALSECCQRGWIGFKADWINKKSSGNESWGEFFASGVRNEPIDITPDPVFLG